MQNLLTTTAYVTTDVNARHGGKYIAAYLDGHTTLTADAAALVPVYLYDSFTGADNTGMVGKPVSGVNTLGSTYIAQGNIMGYGEHIVSNTYTMGADGGVSADITRLSPATFTVSAKMSVGSITGADSATNPYRGVGLGFYPGDGGIDKFVGITVRTNGKLGLVESGTLKNEQAIAGYAATNWYTLSYVVNTGTGSISNVKLSGIDYTFSTTAFTKAACARAGFLSSADAGGKFSFVDDFAVSP